MHLATTIVLTGLAVHQTSATFGRGSWDKASQYTTPDNTDNKCSDGQKTGYDWADLDTGSLKAYGSNKFTGWSCSKSFGKRDLLTKRTFQSKCISSNLDDSPSISCNGDDSMSIHKYQISSSEDADIECHYEMPDKSVCKEYHSCKAGGTEIQNIQCGGAKSVTFKPAESYKGKGCSIGIHSVEFNCGSASTKVPGYASTSEAASSSTPIVYSTTSSETPVPSCSEGSGSSCSSESSPVTQITESISSYQFSTSTEISPVTLPESVPSYFSSSSVESMTGSSSSENSPVTATTPVYSTTSAYNGSVAYSIPAYTPASSEASPSSAPSYASGSGVDVPSSSTAATTTSPAPPMYPPPTTPELLPRCLNTWLYTVQCKDNTDYACFCKDSSFINKVYGCLSSWSPSASNTTNGVSYLMGLCAPYIPQNPAIVTGCPSAVTPVVYTPPASTESSSVPQSSPAPTAPAFLPCTTITYSTEVVEPATYSTGSSQGNPVPSSSCTKTIVTTVTVPQVQITTYTVTESGSTIQIPSLGYATPTSAASTASTSLAQAESHPAGEAALITDSAPSPALPSVTSTSTLVVGPVNGSSGFATSAAATSAPSGIETYQGSGSRTFVGGLLIMAIGAVGCLCIS